MQKIKMLQLLADEVAKCSKCKELVENRTRTVFGDGSPDARILLLGEAPGRDEDKQGIPFVGDAGKLLDNIIASCDWRREDVYICNICKCRPLDNRTPREDEADNCRPFLDVQIKVVNPEYIVCLGACAAQNLLKTKTRIGAMRGKWHNYKHYKVMPTWHPAYLLRNPSAKQDVWNDFQLVAKDMKEKI